MGYNLRENLGTFLIILIEMTAEQVLCRWDGNTRQRLGQLDSTGSVIRRMSSEVEWGGQAHLEVVIFHGSFRIDPEDAI